MKTSLSLLICLLLSPVALCAQNDSSTIAIMGEISVLAGEQGAYVVLGGPSLTFKRGDWSIRPGFAPALRVDWEGSPSFALLGRIQLSHEKIAKGHLRLEIALQPIVGEGWFPAYGVGWKF